MIEYQGTKEVWNAFIAANAEDGGVLQSWEWGEFQESLGRKIWRLAWGNGEIEAACLLVEHRLSPLSAGPRQRRWPFRLKYLYAPRGAVIRTGHGALGMEHVVEKLVQFAREKHAVFFRVEPPYSLAQCSMLNAESVQAVQPQRTVRIDLLKSEDELLQQMHQKTRYNIRLAEKHGVRVTSNQELVTSNFFDIFWKLMQETAKRDGFALHPKEHYKNLIDAAHCSMLNAIWHGQTLATALVAFFGTTAYYLHGASSNAHRDVMAPYALHWSIMQEAKERGCTVYDLWGVDEKKWPGVTRFKTGFAPETPVTAYAGTFDIQVRKGLYTVYRMMSSIRRIRS